MPTPEVVLANVLVVLMATIIGGLLWRRRHRLCWSFTAYLVLAVVTNRLATWWPEAFYTQSFWTLKSAAFAVLLFLVALELAATVFRPFPGAFQTARGIFLVLAGITAVGALWAPAGVRGDDFWALVNHLQPRLRFGASWLFAALAGLVYWYRVPLHEFHRDLLVGFSIDAVVGAVLLTQLSSAGTFEEDFRRLASQAVTIAVALFWARAAWRRETLPDVPLALVRELQPWRL